MIISRWILIRIKHFYTYLWKYLADVSLEWDISMYIHDNISLNSPKNGTLLCTFVIMIRWILIRIRHFYANLWKYLDEFFLEWEISMHVCDNISINSSPNGTFLCTFVIISRWILNRIRHFYAHLWKYIAEFHLEWDTSMYIYDNISLNSS